MQFDILKGCKLRNCQYRYSNIEYNAKFMGSSGIEFTMTDACPLRLKFF